MEKHSHRHMQVLPSEPADPQGRSGSSVAGSHFKGAEVAEERRDLPVRVSQTSQPASRKNIPGGNRAENSASRGTECLAERSEASRSVSREMLSEAKHDSAAENLIKQASPVSTEEQTHPLLAAMIANTTDAIVAIDQAFQVLDFNPAATTMFGWTAENALEYPCSEVLKCRNLNGMLLCGTSSCPLVRVLSDKKPLVREELIIGASATQSCEVAASVIPVDLEHEPYVVFTARDISSLKALNRMRANFISMVSHELRTPLNSVHGFIDLLMQGHMGELTEEQHTYLGYAQEGVGQLISIAEDILLMTRSDLGQFEIKPEEVNFRVLARQVVSSLKPQALKADVVINKDIPSPSPLLYVDPQRMKQVLNNLVTNAIKFTPPGGTVTIAAQAYDEHFVIISVSDKGFGIAPEDQPHVFERFYQSNHRQQSKLGGYGLGLPIAKLIVEQHSGEIGFETEVNRGTTFYFTAPVYRR